MRVCQFRHIPDETLIIPPGEQMPKWNKREIGDWEIKRLKIRDWDTAVGVIVIYRADNHSG